MPRATGTFEVAMKTLSSTEDPVGASLGHLSLDKTFAGDLQGTGKGEMLTAMTKTKGSAGYVAIERVTGTLHGRKGGFVFQHAATMDRGVPKLSIVVVPDSGVDELAGLTGDFKIDNVGGRHSYEFEYSLPA